MGASNYNTKIHMLTKISYIGFWALQMVAALKTLPVTNRFIGSQFLFGLSYM